VARPDPTALEPKPPRAGEDVPERDRHEELRLVGEPFN
jgi:hypothetical protein